MAFLAPLLAPLLGGGALGAIGSALVSTAVGVGLSFVSNSLRPKTKTAGESALASGPRIGLAIDTNAIRQIIIGETLTGGSLAYWQLAGADQEVLTMVIALADHECDGLSGVVVNGKLRTYDAGTGVVGGFDGKLKVRFKSGAAGQTADSALIASSGGRWTSTEVGANVCYAIVEATYDEKAFPDGIPDLGFIVRGMKLYDPRTGVTAYTRNPAVAIYNILRGVVVGGEKLFGMNVPASAIRLAEAQAAANACGEAVALLAGGTEPRYRCGVVLDCDMTNRDALEILIASMAGDVIESAGIYRIMAGVAQAAVANLTDADLIVSEPLTYRPKRGRNQIVNAVLGSYSDPNRNYEQVASPPRTSSVDEEADGDIRLTTTLDLAAVTSRTQAQRILEIERRRARLMASAAMTARARWFVLEPGDWVTLTSDRRGLVSKTFVVQSVGGARDLKSNITLAETDAAFDDWSTALEIADNQVADLPSAGPSFATILGITLTNVLVAGSSGGEQAPGLRVQWTPVTDPTIVQIALEYRKVGDTVALQRTILDPTSGSYTWLDGIQGGTQYEARLRPVAIPDRATNFSSWAPTIANTAPQAVSIAGLALAVPPDTITADMLSQQERFEIGLTTATSNIIGSISQQVADTIASAEQAHTATINALLDVADQRAAIRVEQRLRIENDLSLAEQITTAIANFNDANAVVQQTLSSLASADLTLAQSITTVSTTANGTSAQVSIIAASLDGLGAKFGVAVSLEGYVLGLVQLAASAQAGSTFTVVSDTFKVALPGFAGGQPVPVFSIQNVNGVAKMAFRGDMFADGTITANKLSVASLSALSADLGTVTAGLIRNAANTLRFELPQMRLLRTDGTMELNFESKFFQIVF